MIFHRAFMPLQLRFFSSFAVILIVVLLFSVTDSCLAFPGTMTTVDALTEISLHWPALQTLNNAGTSAWTNVTIPLACNGTLLYGTTCHGTAIDAMTINPQWGAENDSAPLTLGLLSSFPAFNVFNFQATIEGDTLVALLTGLTLNQVTLQFSSPCSMPTYFPYLKVTNIRIGCSVVVPSLANLTDLSSIQTIGQASISAFESPLPALTFWTGLDDTWPASLDSAPQLTFVYVYGMSQATVMPEIFVNRSFQTLYFFGTTYSHSISLASLNLSTTLDFAIHSFTVTDAGDIFCNSRLQTLVIDADFPPTPCLFNLSFTHTISWTIPLGSFHLTPPDYTWPCNLPALTSTLWPGFLFGAGFPFNCSLPVLASLTISSATYVPLLDDIILPFSNLTTLIAASANLSGTIPSSFYTNKPLLQTLDLSNNPSLTGIVPTAIVELTSIRSVSLGATSLLLCDHDPGFAYIWPSYATCNVSSILNACSCLPTWYKPCAQSSCAPGAAPVSDDWNPATASPPRIGPPGYVPSPPTPSSPPYPAPAPLVMPAPMVATIPSPSPVASPAFLVPPTTPSQGMSKPPLATPLAPMLQAEPSPVPVSPPSTCGDIAPSAGSWECSDGIWISIGSVVSIEPVTVNTSTVVVQGDLIAPSLILSFNHSSLVNVTGCQNITSITVEFSQDDLNQIQLVGSRQDVLLQQNGENCSESASAINLFTSSPSSCKSVTKSTSGSDHNTLVVVWSVTGPSSCTTKSSRTWWIVLAAALGFVTLLAIVFVLLTLFNPTVRKKIFPFRDWKGSRTEEANRRSTIRGANELYVSSGKSGDNAMYEEPKSRKIKPSVR